MIFKNSIIICDYIIMIQETINELAKCDGNCPSFTLDGEIHLAKVVKCYDGDTIHCVFKHDNRYLKFNVRMMGYDSSEMQPKKTIEEGKRKEIKAKAVMAKKRLEDLILGKNVYLFCGPFDKYGRLLGTIRLGMDDGITVNQMMIDEGHGYVYVGGTKQVV
jgi:endonuclease YncB( thermonuclease family)